MRIDTSQIEDLYPHVHVETLEACDTEEPKSMLSTELELSQIDPILDYLTSKALLEDKSTSHKVTLQAPHYVLYDGKLYKGSFMLLLLKCLSPFEMNYVLREVYEGICGNHLGGWALAYKILRQGYSWPTVHKDAIEHVRRYDACQRKAPVQYLSTTELTTITAPWLFAQQGIDILRPFPSAPA